jgi:PIN domain nuclease of toxin-antitoxin system
MMAKVLLDTHAFLWWLDGDKRLLRKTRSLIQAEETDVLVSAASVWEITTKARIGKLPGAIDVAVDVPSCIMSQGFTSLAITVEHAQRAGGLPGPHRDPFDRMLIAQAQAERVPLISIDSIFDSYGVTRIWR